MFFRANDRHEITRETHFPSFVIPCFLRNISPLVQDIKHEVASLSEDYKFILHWIPAHIDSLSFHQFSIEGNSRADRLANQAREMSSNSHPCERDLNLVRGEIMCETAKLLWKIKELLIPSDGSCSGDFSSANVNQIILRDNLR